MRAKQLMKRGPWINVALRELVWLGAFVVWVSFKKPADARLVAIRLDPVGRLGLCLVGAGLVAHLWSALALARAIGTATGHTGGLAKQGPYQYVRNPLYLAGALVFVGLYLLYAEFRLIDFVAAGVVGLLLHLYVVRVEEPATRQRLGAECDEYCRQVPRWMPRLPFTAQRTKGSD